MRQGQKCKQLFGYLCHGSGTYLKQLSLYVPVIGPSLLIAHTSTKWLKQWLNHSNGNQDDDQILTIFQSGTHNSQLGPQYTSFYDMTPVAGTVSISTFLFLLICLPSPSTLRIQLNINGLICCMKYVPILCVCLGAK